MFEKFKAAEKSKSESLLDKIRKSEETPETPRRKKTAEAMKASFGEKVATSMGVLAGSGIAAYKLWPYVSAYGGPIAMGAGGYVALEKGGELLANFSKSGVGSKIRNYVDFTPLGGMGRIRQATHQKIVGAFGLGKGGEHK